MGDAFVVLNFVLDQILRIGCDVDLYEKPMINGNFSLTSLKFALFASRGFCDYILFSFSGIGFS